MDQSNPTDPNQPAPAPLAPSVPPPPMDQPAPVQPDPTSVTTPPPVQPDLPQAPLSSELPPTLPPVEPAEPVAADPAPAQPVSWDAPTTPDPVPAAAPEQTLQPSPDWSQPVAPPEPSPAPPPEQPVSWDSQPQAAPIEPAPVTETPVPETPQSSVDLSSLSAPQPEIRSDAAPTDLSSLAAALGAPNIAGITPQPVADPAQPVTTPQAPASAEAPTVVTGSHGLHIPKVALIIGAVVGLLAVLGASAYFILGVGQSADTTSVIPAEQQSLTNPPRANIPTPTPIPSLDSGTSLGSLNGATPSAQATPSGQIAPGSSSVFDRRATQ